MSRCEQCGVSDKLFCTAFGLGIIGGAVIEGFILIVFFL